MRAESTTPWLLLALSACLLGSGCVTASPKEDDELGDTDKKESGDSDSDRKESGDGDDPESASVKVRHKELADAVKETSEGGRGRHDPQRLRQALCEGYESQPKIFYHLVVSTHWHYYWICSDDRPHRVSSRRGKRNLEAWLRGFKRQASVQSQDCAGSGSRKALTGNHESGIQAVAYCDGRVVLTFPDGGQTQTSFQARSGGGGGSGNPPDEPGGGREPAGGNEGGGDATATATCPPCPSCAPTRSRTCPECPVCTACPPPRSCPACPPQRTCPPPDCSKPALEAGQKAFRQGVDKACKRICDLIYKKCRSINPNTALCYQLSEFCATECVR